MRKLIYIIPFLIIGVSSYAQDQEVKLGTSFIIQFNDLKNLHFEIKSLNEYKGLIDTNSNIDSIFKDEPNENQIFGVFTNGRFGTKTSPILVLVSGLKGYIDYDLKIKLPGKKKFRKTSTLSLLQGVSSIEHWPYPIEKIKFKKFIILPEQNIQEFEFEEKIDSICIKNPELNINYGEQEFKIHLEKVITGFNEDKDFKLEGMLNYENSFGFDDVSLGHYWSLGESIYPNERGFKFGNPVSYRRVECPYFEGKSNYFYTTNDKSLKVVSFNWETFKESNFGVNFQIKNEIDDVFNKKFEFIFKVVSNFLGDPIENITEESGQRKIKWKSEKGINAYLFNFGNYNEIRLYIYKE